MTTKTQPISLIRERSSGAERVDLDNIIDRLAAARAEIDGLYHELERLNRLASMGTMAGMIAHEFNNILTPVLSYSQMALAAPADLELSHKALQRSVSGAARAAKMADAILNFVRDDPHGGPSGTSATRSTCNIAQVVRDSLTCLARDPSRDGVFLHVDVPDDLNAAIDPVVLQQALVNLILNARHAMAAAGRLEVNATTHATEPQTPTAALDSRAESDGIPGNQTSSMWNELCRDGAASGRWITLSVRDSGSGISATQLARLFHPFSTGGGTTAKRGNGLGMVITKRLIEAAGGWIIVQSTPGAGTNVTIVLPQA